MKDKTKNQHAPETGDDTALHEQCEPTDIPKIDEDEDE
tara:strand:+ start:1929 stop:2042 length:114 start_codon:yes stop_codon:yes gene_type:complete